jgi:hypothetical protein
MRSSVHCILRLQGKATKLATKHSLPSASNNAASTKPAPPQPSNKLSDSALSPKAAAATASQLPQQAEEMMQAMGKMLSPLSTAALMELLAMGEQWLAWLDNLDPTGTWWANGKLCCLIYTDMRLHAVVLTWCHKHCT